MQTLGGTRISPAVVKDDRILPFTRLVSAAVVPFLILAFIILYLNPEESGQRFAWEIQPRLTAMYMGAGYLGGAYLFAQALSRRSWHRVAPGIPAVTVFTISMLLVTILHRERFDLNHTPFQLWLVLYIVTPILVPSVGLLNGKPDPGTPEPLDAPVPAIARIGLGVLGGLLLVYAVVTFITPEISLRVWPWRLTALTARVLAGWCALLGVGGLTISRERRWSAWKVGLTSIALWHTLVLLTAALNPGDFNTGRPVNWYTASVAQVLLGMGVLYAVMERRNRQAGA
jgi:hypothetical protein